MVWLMKKLFFALSLLCVVTFSCSTLSPDKPPIDFDPTYLNQQIKLVVIKELSAFQARYPVTVLLQYNSSNEIVFPNNFNLRIFIRQNTQWIEIREKPSIRPKDQIVLSENNPTSFQQIVMFSPALDDLTKTYYVRVYVFGDMKTSEGSKQVGAFADFVLTP